MASKCLFNELNQGDKWNYSISHIASVGLIYRLDLNLLKKKGKMEGKELPLEMEISL